MKNYLMLCLLCILLHPAVAEADASCRKGDDCLRVYVATGMSSLINEDSDLYDGIELPVYMGYFTLNLTRNKFDFTKKTPYMFKNFDLTYKVMLELDLFHLALRKLPDGNLEKYFAPEAVEKLRNQWATYHLSDHFFRRNPESDLWTVLERRFDLRVLGYSKDETGVNPDEVNPVFYKRCTYLPWNDPPEYCSDREKNDPFFSMVPDYRITAYPGDIKLFEEYVQTGKISWWPPAR